MPEKDRPTRRGTFLTACAAALGVIALVYITGLQVGFGARWGLFSGALAFPGIVFAGLLAASLVLSAVAVASGRASRPARIVTGSVSAGLLAAMVVTLAVTPAPIPPESLPARSADALRLLAWNVQQTAESPDARNRLIETLEPDVVVFSELYEGNLQSGDLPAGYVSYGVRGIAVTVLVTDDLPPFRVSAADDSGATSGFVLTPETDGAAPEIVAVHLVRPGIDGDTTLRDRGLDWIAEQCASPDAIAAGDFNAVAPNMPRGRLGFCRSAAAFAPSWPASIPPLFGAAIDNVLVSERWDAERVATLDVPGIRTDHRPIVADVVPALIEGAAR